VVQAGDKSPIGCARRKRFCFEYFEGIATLCVALEAEFALFVDSTCLHLRND
jgi:hypothetical protein